MTGGRHEHLPRGRASAASIRPAPRLPMPALRGKRDERSISSSSRPRASAGEFADGASVLEAARKLGVDLDSVCGGRGICGRCQIDVAEGEFAKHALYSARDHVTPWSEVEQRYADKRGALAAGPPARLPGAHSRRSRRRRAGRNPGSSPGRAQARGDASDRDRSGRSPLLCRGRRARHARSLERSAALAAGARRAMGRRRSRGRVCRCCAACRRRCAPAQWKVTVALRKGPRHRRRPAGLRASARSASPSTSARRRSPRISAISRAARSSPPPGAMNPQIRFGEDLMSRVSYVMMNPGRRRRADAAACARRSTR